MPGSISLLDLVIVGIGSALLIGVLRRLVENR